MSHTLTPCSPACERDSGVPESLFLFCFFVLFYLFCYYFCFGSPLYCMDDSSYCDKVFQKRFYGTHHYPALSLVFQMQKECFSLPANKATITLFFYTNGKKKYIYKNLYINVVMQILVGVDKHDDSTIQIHGSLGETSGQ